MSNVKTVFEKLNRFVFTIFLLFTHRCETQEVEVKNTQPNFVATKFFLFYTNKGIIISSKWVAPLFVSRGNRLGWKFPPYTCNLIVRILSYKSAHIYIYMWNISHVRIVVRNWIPKRFFSETWSILLKIFSKIFLSSQKWMLARKNSCHKMKRSKNGWHHSGHTFFHSEQRGKVRSRLTVKRLRVRL